MSRVIKFRGRSTSEVDAEGSAAPIRIGDWVYDSLIVAEGEAFIVNGVVESNWEYIALEEWCPVDPATVGQFSGLKDKKGAEIYQGDVVEHGSRDELDFGVGTVEWNKEWACFELKCAYDWGDTHTSNEVIAASREWRVIGNIHEHPHLLESAS